MPRLHAQPYDLSATGFYFDSADDYDRQVQTVRNDFGQPVEEFEIQFIDGDEIDCALAKAIGLTQASFRDFLTCSEKWDDREKTLVVIAVGECGCDFDPDTSPDHYDIDIYYVDSMRELAAQFVDEGLLGEIPEHLRLYFDYDAFARDLSVEYSSLTIAGRSLIYRAS